MTYPNQLSKLISLFQIVAYSDPANNLVADMSEMGVKLWFALPCLKIVILNKSQVEGLIYFRKVEYEGSIMIVRAIV